MNAVTGTSTSAPGSSSRALHIYVQAVVATGCLVLIGSAFAAVRTPHPLWCASLAALAMVTGYFRLNFASVSANIAIDDTFFMTTALFFGPAPATLAVAVSSLIVSSRRRQPARQRAFNVAATAVSLWAGAQTFFLVARVPVLVLVTPSTTSLVAPILAFTVVFFGLNSGLTAVAVGLDARQSPFQIWRRHFQWLSINYFGAASVSFCLILLIQQANVVAMVIVLPLLAVFHLTLRTSFGRAEDATVCISRRSRRWRWRSTPRTT